MKSQNKVKHETRGRKPVPANRKSTNYSVSLTPAEYAKVMCIGEGSLTRGIKTIVQRSKMGERR